MNNNSDSNNSFEILKALEIGLKEAQKNPPYPTNKNILSSSNAFIGDLKNKKLDSV